MRLNLNNFTLVKNALLARRLFGSAIINENSKSLVSSSSSSSSLNLSAFCVNPASRQYSSYPILNRNRNSNSKFLLVVGKNSSNRTMSTTQVNFKLERAFDNIVKSSQDKREYRGLLLDNGLKCLLISDPTTDRSAAAVDVHAGYLLDPKEFPGLAHFCEHMLFMGSKKYPQENLFMKFIEDHAGHTNAYTSSENTNYHFEVSTGKFKEALDIFAQFFISPLFDASSTDREINAVDSENQKNLKSDAWRLDQLEKAQAREDHPYSKFGTGNLDTLKTEPEKLGLSVREELLRFHTKYYSSNLMSLVLLGKESLEELQQYAVEMFSDIPNKNLPKVDFDPNPYSEDALATIKYINPVQDIRQLSIAWTVPDLRDKYASGPAQYLTHLVGHEGEGSLLSELKRRGWCNNLYAGSRREVRGFQFFNLTVDLSEEGGENLNGVIKCVYEYINMVKRNGPSKWVFDEYAKLGKLSFDFKDKETPINYVASLASDLHVLEIPDVLSAHYYPTKYEPDEIVALFPYLEPKKMRVSAISKKYEGKTDRTEKWYGTEYKLERLDEQLVKELSSSDLSNDRLRLPAPNDFIPVDLDLIKHDTDSLPKHPRIVYSNGLTRLWYKEDNKFLLPKAAIRLELRNPLVYFSPVNVNMTAIFVDLLLDSLTEYLYPAEMADLRYRIIATSYGLNVNVHGFNDKIDRLLKTIFERMVNFTVDPERFKILKERYTRNLMNFEADQPYKHSVYYLTLLISEKGWEKKQLMETVNDFSIEDLQHFIHQTLSNGVFIDSIVFGNLSHQKAIEIVKSVEETLSNGTRKVKPLEAIYLKNFRQFHLPDGESHVFTKNNVVHKTAGIEVYYQCGQQTTHDNALVELFCQVINESSFNVLRTQEQLGYIVASGVRNFGGVNGVRLIIQSDRPPLYLDERIENFLKMTQETIEAMTDEEFQTHVEALALTKLEEPKKMTKQCEIYWNEIISHQYHFDRENDEVDQLRKLTKADLTQFFYEFISAESNKRRKLAVYIYPPEMNAEHTKENLKATLIEDRNEWQNGLPLYSLPKPHIKIN